MEISREEKRLVEIDCLKKKIEMKGIFIVLLAIFPGFGFAQVFPEVLTGTWKDSTSGIYETWGKAGDKHLKGISYELKNGEKVISEYMEIEEKENKMIYTVMVKNQNNEKPVNFVLSATDSIYTFVNHAHDFPTFIRYTIVSPTYIRAKVGNNSRSFTLYYHRTD